MPSTTKADLYRDRRTEHWEAVAGELGEGHDLSGGYHERIETIYRFLVAPGQRVIELGSGTGDLLAAVQPSFGLGIDLSPKMVEVAGQRHPELVFQHADVHDLVIDETFDVVILSDLVDDIWDVLIDSRIRRSTVRLSDTPNSSVWANLRVRERSPFHTLHTTRTIRTTRTTRTRARSRCHASATKSISRSTAPTSSGSRSA